MDRVIQLALSAILAACAAGSTGCISCISRVPYPPERDIVQRVGVERAGARLKTLIEQAIAPHMTAPAEVTEESMRYTFLGAFWTPWAHQIRFKDVTRIDLCENNRTFLYD